MKKFEKWYNLYGGSSLEEETAKNAWKAALENILNTHDETDNWGNVAADILEELKND